MKTFTERLTAVLTALQVPDGGGHELHARDYFGHGGADGALHTEALPSFWLLRKAADDLEVRIEPVSRDGRVNALWVGWTIDGAFVRATDPGSILEHIRPRLARLPRPSAFIDAGAEVVAIWQLQAPIQADEALPMLQQMAEALDAAPIENLRAVTLPLCGVVRTVGNRGGYRRMTFLELTDGRHAPAHIVPTEHARPGRKRR